MDDAEYDEIQDAADAARLTISAWVRRSLRAQRARASNRPEGATVPAVAGPAPSPARDGTGRPPDDGLVRAVMERHGISSPAEAVDFALRRAAEPPLAPGDLLALRGTGWSGDLEAVRAHPMRGTKGSAGARS